MKKEQHYQDGLNYINDKMYDKAIEAFTNALNEDPEYLQAYLQRGNAYCLAPDSYMDQASRTILALEDYQKVMKSYMEKYKTENDIANVSESDANTFAETFFNLANIYHNEKKYNDAIEGYDALMDLIEKTHINTPFIQQILPQLHTNRGYAYYYIGKEFESYQTLTDAVENLQKAVELKPINETTEIKAKIDEIKQLQSEIQARYGTWERNGSNYTQGSLLGDFSVISGASNSDQIGRLDDVGIDDNDNNNNASNSNSPMYRRY